MKKNYDNLFQIMIMQHSKSCCVEFSQSDISSSLVLNKPNDELFKYLHNVTPL